MVEWTVIICVGVRSITKFMLTYSLLFQNNYNYAGMAIRCKARQE